MTPPVGVGNQGFVSRFPQICAAGLPLKEANATVGRLPDCFKQYLLQDEVDALLGDAIIPQVRRLDKMPHVEDKRHAVVNTEIKSILNPPILTKFQELTNEVKNTVYSSYWKKSLGRGPDPVAMLPEGMNISEETFGKPSPIADVSDVISPKLPPIDLAPKRRAAYQTNRNYCEPFSKDDRYGKKTYADHTGKRMKCCLTDDREFFGKALATVVSSTKADFDKTHVNKLARTLVTSDIMSDIPKDFAFGKVDQSPFSSVESCLNRSINLNEQCIKQCIGYLNSLRKFLSQRYDSKFFRTLYLSLKYIDKEKSGWLPKTEVYKYCATKHIRMDPSYMDPLLFLWDALSDDKERIEYKTFVDIINHQIPPRSLPKISEMPRDAFYSTTYKEMVKPGQDVDTRIKAGLPTGRYFDRDYPVVPPDFCKAHLTYLPDESSVQSCISPSLLTSFGISHRDMYAARNPEIVRRVFEAYGEKFPDDKFEKVWNDAKKYHPQGLVSYESFRRALNKKSQKF